MATRRHPRRPSAVEMMIMAATGNTLIEIRHAGHVARRRATDIKVPTPRTHPAAYVGVRMACPECGRDTAVIGHGAVLANHTCVPTLDRVLAKAEELESARRADLIEARTLAATGRAWTFRVGVMLFAVLITAGITEPAGWVGVLVGFAVMADMVAATLSANRWRQGAAYLPAKRELHDEAMAGVVAAKLAVDQRDIAADIAASGIEPTDLDQLKG